MGAMRSQITNLTIVYSTVHLGLDQRKHQSSASLAFVWVIPRLPMNSPRNWPVTRKCFRLMTSSRLLRYMYKSRLKNYMSRDWCLMRIVCWARAHMTAMGKPELQPFGPCQRNLKWANFHLFEARQIGLISNIASMCWSIETMDLFWFKGR